jgi:thermitase
VGGLGRYISILCTALIMAAALLTLMPGASSEVSARTLDGSSDAPYVAGELVVTYKPGTATKAAEATSSATGGRAEKELPATRGQLLSFPEVKNEKAQATREGALEREKQTLEQNPAVEAVDYNYIYRASASPNDPLFNTQYGLQKPRFSQAWDKVRGTPDTKIAVVDSGVYAEHPDLQGKIAEQYDFVNDDPIANDDYGHGTHVTGIAAAITDNGQGIAGGCPDCGLLIAKVLGSDGSGTLSDLAEGIIWSADRGAKVINMSLESPHPSTALGNAIDYAAGKGVVLTAAAGNDSSSKPFYPAAYPNVIAVAATDSTDRGESFSNYGGWVDVAAPGVKIISTTSDGGYGTMTGTSMASAEVAALAGLLAAQGRPRSDIHSRIFSTATDLRSKARHKIHHKSHHKARPQSHRKGHHKGHHKKERARNYGHGRIDAALAVK